MRYLSLFSGIEAASQAWAPLGWECVGFSEIEAFPARLLAARWPGIPNLGDVTKITEADILMLGHIDLIVFGSPCQDLSVAGKRKGLQGDRSGLFFAAMDIIGWAREWCGLRGALWENVPGAFNSNAGADFAAVVGALAGLECPVPPKGWGTEGAAIGTEGMVEWATLDAQHFGVAQRRRRVFALADFGDWSGRPPVLLEPEGLRGDSAPRRGPGEGVAGTLAASSGGGGDVGPVLSHEVVSSLDASFHRLQGCSGQDMNHGHSHLVAYGGNNTSQSIDVAPSLLAQGGWKGDFESETFIVQGAGTNVYTDMHVTGTLRGNCDRVSGSAPMFAYMPARTLQPDGSVLERFAERDVCDAVHGSTGSGNKAPVVIGFYPTNRQPEHGNYIDVAPTLKVGSGPGTGANAAGVAYNGRVRRLTPRECERLQGMADDYTLIPKAADGPRYKALGNSMAVPVMNWIGRQIDYAWNYF
jgi:DNA (cytosine-5)-methyltransferase 1